VRRIFFGVLLCCIAGIAGVANAAPRKPVPTPTPSPSPSPTPARPTVPLVLVYPFDVSSEMKPDTGVRAALLFVAQMNAAGGILARNAPPNVRRPSYLTFAKRANADYYVAGYMTPLGDGVSLVEQVVSTQSGAIVFGTTAQIESFEDAASQAVAIHDGIIARERSLTGGIAANEAQATPTPLPNNEANIGSFAGGLFKHRPRATPAPHPAAKPSKGVIVVHVTGAPPTVLSQATTVLFYSLQSYYNVRMAGVSPENLAATADRICGADRNNTIASGTVATQSVHRGFFARTQYTFTLDVYTCFGARLDRMNGVGNSLASAIGAAVQSYAQAHPLNA